MFPSIWRIAGQSPIAQTPGQSGTSVVWSTTIRPCAAEAAARGSWEWQRRENRMRARGDGGPQRCGSRRLRAAGLLLFDEHRVRGHGLQTRSEPDFDAPVFEKLVRKSGKRWGQLRENPSAALQQYQAQIVFGDVVVGAHSLPQKIVHLGDAFDARKSPAGHHKGEQAPAVFGIAFRLRFLEHPDELIA